VRRRLFEPMRADHFKLMDVTAREFAEMYRTQQQEFPNECRENDYEKRIRAAYPIHPEVFTRLYEDWSTLIKFQRTRGVLRLMAAVIHSLWEKGDRNPLIMPANIPIDDTRVRDELTRYLSDNWKPIIEKDVDGPDSLPLSIDGEVPNLGKFSACRRVARTVYLGSAPTTSASNKGVEDRRVKLGCAMPGETTAVFGDALRRLAQVATFLYQDGSRYWYDTQPTVTKLAEDRAEQLKRTPDKISHELDRRLRTDLAQRGEFGKIHPLPASGVDIPDDTDARLVVLGIDFPYSKEPNNPAEVAAKALLENRGNSPRRFRNTLVFLAPDKQRIADLDEGIRKYLAWESILAQKDTLDLRPHQVKQAETLLKAADSVVVARLPETYQWLLVPAQPTPQSPMTWDVLKLSGQLPLAERASKKLKSDELLLPSLGASRLRMELDKVPLWRGNLNHVGISQLADDFAQYVYLPRLTSTGVLLDAIRNGVNLLTWTHDGFAFAEAYDEAAGRYKGLVAGRMIALIDPHSPGVVVKPEVAAKQLDEEGVPTPGGTPGLPGAGGGQPQPMPGGAPQPEPPQGPAKPKRFHGTATLDASRVGRDAGKIAEEVISHLVGLVGANVTVTIEIEAQIPEGAPDNVVRTVTENARTLKFTSQGFEKE